MELEFTVVEKIKNSEGKRYHHKDNNADYTILADFGDELCLLREDINVRILMKRVDFEKYLKEIV